MEINIKDGYKISEVGVIPDDWEVYTIKSTLKLINGCAFKPRDWKKEGLPIIRIQNLNDLNASYNYFDGKVDEKYYVNYGDILFAWSGTKESSFGARMWLGSLAILNQHIFRVIPNQDKLISHYALLVLLKVQEDIETKAHGFKSSFVHIKKSDLESIQLPLPPLSEQKAIAHSLSDVDNLITAIDQLITKKRNIKQGTMQQLLTGKKRLPGFSGKWEVKKLGDIVDFLDGKRIPLKDSDRAKIRGLYPYYGASGIIDYVNDYIFDDELILLGEDGDNILSRNSKLAFKVFGKVWVNNHAHVLKPKPEVEINFLTEYLESLNYEQYNTGTAQPKINQKVCSSIPVILPNFPEQKAIAEILSDIDKEIEALEKNRDKYKAIKQGMMQELLTGKTRLKIKVEDRKNDRK